MSPTVVVGYDQTSHSERALDEAAAEAVRRAASLTVVHAFRPPSVPPPPPHGPSTGASAAHIAAQQIADQGAGRARDNHPGLEVDARVAAGEAPAVLADLAHDADLLVVGHRGRGCSAGLLPCAVAVRTVLSAACPVLVVRGGDREPRGTVLAAVDLEDQTEGILAVAFDEASRRRTGLKAISVREKFWPQVFAGGAADLRTASIEAEENADLALESLLKPWRAAYPEVHVRRELADGSPGVVLTAATTHSDLMVMGAHRHHGSPADRRHIGPTVHELLLHADCPVAVVPRTDDRAGSARPYASVKDRGTG